MIGEHGPKDMGLFPGSAGQDVGVAVEGLPEEVGAVGYGNHPGLLAEGLFKCLKLIGQVVGLLHHQHLLFGEAELLVLDIAHLFPYHEGADNQTDRDQELEHHQHAAQQRGAPVGGGLAAFEHLHRLEGGQEEGRIAAGQDADGNTQRRQCRQGVRIAEILDVERFSGQVVEEGEHQFHHDQRQNNGDEAHEYGLGQELQHQLAAVGAEGLADAHLLGPAGGAGGGQVHEVDAGNQQDRQRDHRKSVDRPGIAIGFEFPFQVGIEVDVGERLQEEAVGPAG